MSKGFLLASVWGCSHGPVKSLPDKSRHKAQTQLSRTLKHSLSVILIFHCLSFTRTGFDHLSLFTSVHLAFTAFTLRELSTHFWS